MKLFLASPAYGGFSPGCVESLVRLTAELQRRNTPFVFCPISWPDIAYARGWLAGALLRTEATHMLMFDSDITFPVDLVFRMLERDVDFIGAAAPMRKIRWEQFATAARNSCPNPATQALEFEAFFTPAQKQSGNLETERGTCEVESVGGGFLLLHRSVIERVAEAHPDLRFRGQHDEECFDIFASLIVDGRRLDEDVSFVHRWKALGGAVHLMLDAPLGHHGSFTFRGNFVETLMASAFLRPGP